MDGQEGKAEGNLPVAGILEEEETPQDNVFALAAKVFGNGLLREIIVNHAIHDGHRRLNSADICSIRAVAKNWNDSVCKQLKKNIESLLHIKVSGQIHLNDVQRNENCAEFFDNFTKTFACSPRVLDRGPTFNLELLEEAFHQDNYNGFHNFFNSCGHGLSYILAWIPRNGGSLSGIFPNLSLPSLHSASLVFTGTDMEGGIRESDNVTNLLQSIFSGANDLVELMMFNQVPMIYQSSVFRSTIVPPSVERALLAGLSSEDMEILLVENKPPNLSVLNIRIDRNSLRDGLLSKILQNVRYSLKKLNIKDYDTTRAVGDVRPSADVFRFPRMEKLDTFRTYSENCILDPGTYFLGTLLPKLRVLGLGNQSEDTLRKWTKGARISSVKELSLVSTKDGTFSLDRDTMSQIHLAFPNVTKLELQFAEAPLAGLQCMFTKMTNLVNLKLIKLEATLFDWDSVLIGTSAGFTAALREEPALWEKIQINNDEDPSVRKLTELRTLSIHDYTQDALLTDLAFHFAFLKMPMLQKLELSHGFLVSAEMTDKWESEGRILKYTD